jgi:hypothetical protein
LELRLKGIARMMHTSKIAGQPGDVGGNEARKAGGESAVGYGISAAALAVEVCTVTVAELGVPFNVTVPGETVQVEPGGPPLQVSETVWVAAVPGMNDTANVAG